MNPWLHSVIISFHRLELTQQVVESYLATVSVDHSAVVVDNGSGPEVQDWLLSLGPEFGLILLRENHYPGYATNRGFERAPKQTTLLHRADNDFSFRPGWDQEVLARFAENPRLGQLGLRTDAEELHAPWNVGGNAIIRRELWDQGLRYDERPWEQLGATTEDYYLSQDVQKLGYEWGRVQKPCIISLATGDLADDYYVHSYGVRGIFTESEIARKRQKLGIRE